MIRRLSGALLLGAAILLAPAAQADEPVRSAVGKPLLQAQAYARRGDYRAALARVAAADAVRDKTANEELLIAQMRASIAQQSGDYQGAIAADEDLLRTGHLGAAQQQNLLMAEAGSAYQLHDYARTETAIERYEKAGGRSPEMRKLLIQVAFLQKDYAKAAQLQQATIQQQIRAGQTPSETDLQLLANCQIQTSDKSGLAATMTDLVRYYPKPDYWAQLLQGLRADPNVPDRLQFDVDRLRLATGNMTATADYINAAEIAVQNGLPNQALAVMNQGYQTGALGKDAGAAREARLVALIRQQIAQKKTELPGQLTEAESVPDGNALVSVGYSMVDSGEDQPGLAAMQRGIAKGHLTSVDEARLHLGLAYMMAGDKADALKTLQSVTNGPAGEIASLWTLRMGSKA